MKVKFDLDQTAQKKSDLMQRAIDHMEPTDKQTALALIMSWMSIAAIEDMVDFWDERL